MAPVQPFQLVPIGPSGRAMADMVDATGTANFGAVLLNHLQEACGADYCAVFRIGADAPSEFVTGSYDGSLTAHSRVDQYLQRRYWSKDPAMTYVQTRLAGPAPMLMRMDVSHLGDEVARETIWPRIRDRLVVAGRSRDCAYSISILREGRGGFTAAEVERVSASADLLISVLAKHADLVGRSDVTNVSGIVSSLPDIDACIASTSTLTRREREVCARVLYGLTTTGIALDLGVSNETVKTFRKLAYRRLGIGSERELLQWYLARRDDWHRAGR
jgi:DNA-binding CsgD family transcriptional regulator